MRQNEKLAGDIKTHMEVGDGDTGTGDQSTQPRMQGKRTEAPESRAMSQEVQWARWQPHVSMVSATRAKQVVTLEETGSSVWILKGAAELIHSKDVLSRAQCMPGTVQGQTVRTSSDEHVVTSATKKTEQGEASGGARRLRVIFL